VVNTQSVFAETGYLLFFLVWQPHSTCLTSQEPEIALMKSVRGDCRICPVGQ